MFMVVKDGLPLNLVEGEGFRCFVQKALPLYKLPSRRTFTEMIDSKYKVLSERVRSIFSTIDQFNITADTWTHSNTTQSYMGITVHFLQGTQMKSASIGVLPLTESHTSEYLSQQMTKTCTDWKIEPVKVNHAVIDNAINMVNSAKLAFGSSKQMGCFAHTLNLVAEKAIESVTEMGPLITKVKTIVTFFKHSANASDELKKVQELNGRSEGKTLELIQSVVTRWNFTYLMIDRFIQLSAFVGAILLRFDHVEMLTGNELSSLKEICRVLKPLYNATCELSAEKHTTVSKIIPMMNLMKQLLLQMDFAEGRSSSVASALREELVKQINKRFGQMEYVETFSIATLIDPRFKKIHFREPVAHSRAVTKLSAMVMAMQRKNASQAQETQPAVSPSPNVDNLWSLHDAMVASTNTNSEPDNPGGIPSELRLYMNSPLSPRDIDPLQVWETYKPLYPHLYLIARDYLSRMATSVPAERLFSKAGDIATEKRSRLTGKRLSSLIFLQSLEADFFFSTQ